MIAQTDVETLYMALDEGASILENELEIPYLDALAEMGESLFREKVIQSVNETTLAILQKKIATVSLDDMAPEAVRKAFQLAVLKGMKGAIQPNHALTPDAVCVFISYLVNKVTAKKKEGFSVLDLAVGSGNLLTAIVNQALQPVKGYGFEADETLLKLAFVSANLQQQEIELFHKDSVRPFSFVPVDVIVSDLPIGYYPNDDVAEPFELKAEKGHSYVHHLLIEQGVKRAKEGGFLLFMVPNFLFESDQAEQLHQYLKKHTVIHGLLQLPLSMFKAAKQGKSILMLQKKGPEVRQPQQALLAELPSFSKKEALADMLQQIDRWFEEQLGIS
ncbi:class I SAM-dependent methyltransferase [Halalkalibacterium ligniniphilum]|uniref:class I SAM-dependent methyltransferase n=1 Tax=Halalkalibacterium ligniniphilum TaxID=1134413 RepID=UPI00034B2F47|nr:class I SAM-dependent methyltransferase [Halalkalibacterium ligniniphilum]